MAVPIQALQWYRFADTVNLTNSIGWLYVFAFLHQTTTCNALIRVSIWLYVFAFLHQTTTNDIKKDMIMGCMSLLSYIKPQLYVLYLHCKSVVCLCFPTSNHNPLATASSRSVLYVFAFLHQTTTYCNVYIAFHVLYVFAFLHQTTTQRCSMQTR